MLEKEHDRVVFIGRHWLIQKHARVDGALWQTGSLWWRSHRAIARIEKDEGQLRLILNGN